MRTYECNNEKVKRIFTHLCANAGRVNTENISIYIYGKETKGSKEKGDEKEAPLVYLTLECSRKHTAPQERCVFF